MLVQLLERKAEREEVLSASTDKLASNFAANRGNLGGIVVECESRRRGSAARLAR